MEDRYVRDCEFWEPEVDINSYNVVLIRVGDKWHRAGEVVMMEDGYYQFFPDLSRGGYWSTSSMRAIADMVDLKNRDWDDEVQEYFSSNTVMAGED